MDGVNGVDPLQSPLSMQPPAPRETRPEEAPEAEETRTEAAPPPPDDESGTKVDTYA